MQYHNTPLPDLKLSPAQILFHRQLRDHIPAHPSQYQLHEEWLLLAKSRETLLQQRNKRLLNKYNSTAHALKPLTIGTKVVVQSNTGRRLWNRTGVIVECLPYRQYTVRMNGSGRVTLRNRRFLRPDYVLPHPLISPSAHVSEKPSKLTVPPNSIQSDQLIAPPAPLPRDISELSSGLPAIDSANQSLPSSPSRTSTLSEGTVTPTETPDVPPMKSKIPRMLRNLHTYNLPGRKEGDQIIHHKRNEQPSE